MDSTFRGMRATETILGAILTREHSMTDEPLTEVQIRFQCEIENSPMPDDCIRELAAARACRLFEVDGKSTMAINRAGLEIVMKYAADRRRADLFREHIRSLGY